MLVGTANSSSVAEHALFLMLTLAKRGGELRRALCAGRWAERLTAVPIDLLGKTVLRRRLWPCWHARRQALPRDGNDGYRLRSLSTGRNHAGGRMRAGLRSRAALPQADFVTIHCPRSAETIGMFGAVGCSA